MSTSAPTGLEKLPPKEAMEGGHCSTSPTKPDPARSRLTCQLKVSPALDGLVVADAGKADLMRLAAALFSRPRGPGRRRREHQPPPATTTRPRAMPTACSATPLEYGALTLDTSEGRRCASSCQRSGCSRTSRRVSPTSTATRARKLIASRATATSAPASRYMVSTASSRRRSGSAGPTAGLAPIGPRPISTATEPWTSPSSTVRIWRRPSGSFSWRDATLHRGRARARLFEPPHRRGFHLGRHPRLRRRPRDGRGAAADWSGHRLGFAGRGEGFAETPLSDETRPRRLRSRAGVLLTGCPSSWRKYPWGSPKGRGVKPPSPAASEIRQGPPADIAPHLRAREADAVDEPVGAPGCIREGVAPAPSPRAPAPPKR